MIDATHHEGMGKDIPRGRAGHQPKADGSGQKHDGSLGRDAQHIARQPIGVIEQQQSGKGRYGPREGRTRRRKVVGKGCQPSGQRRFFNPRLAVHRRQQPMMVDHHLARRYQVAAFHNVGLDQLIVGQKEHGTKEQEQPHAPTGAAVEITQKTSSYHQHGSSLFCLQI